MHDKWRINKWENYRTQRRRIPRSILTKYLTGWSMDNFFRLCLQFEGFTTYTTPPDAKLGPNHREPLSCVARWAAKWYTVITSSEVLQGYSSKYQESRKKNSEMCLTHNVCVCIHIYIYIYMSIYIRTLTLNHSYIYTQHYISIFSSYPNDVSANPRRSFLARLERRGPGSPASLGSGMVWLFGSHGSFQHLQTDKKTQEPGESWFSSSPNVLA